MTPFLSSIFPVGIKRTILRVFHIIPPPFLSVIPLHLSPPTSLPAAVSWLTSYRAHSAVGGASTEIVSVAGCLAMHGQRF